jgi:GPH family glycoside/pentoside/hexuronide:cation symporter
MTGKTNEALPTKTKILYGAGDFGFSLTDTTIGVLYAIFLTDVVGIRAGNAAWVFLIGRIWDFVNDPVMGYISDRTRSRWGRRRPYLLFGFIPFAIAFTLLWIKPPLTGEAALVAYYAFAYVLYDAAATAVYMPYFALTPELTLDYDERTKLTSYRMFFSIIAGLVAFTVPLAVIGRMRPENADKVLMIGAIFGLASALPLLLTFFGTRERPEFQTQSTQPIMESLRAAFKNRPFVFAMFIFLFTWAAVNLVQSMMLFFLKYRMNLEDESDLIMGTVFVTALLTLPFWEWASRNTDKRKSYIGGMVFLSVVLTILAFLSPDAGMTFVLLLAFLAGIGVAAVHVLPWSMIPDAVEWDEYETGRRHEGMFYSLVTLLRKVASAIAIPSMLWILEASGFVSNAPTQSDSAIKAIIGLTGPGPAFFMFLGIFFALFYPLSRERHSQIRKELEGRRKA